jgi:hypothetical protein
MAWNSLHTWVQHGQQTGEQPGGLDATSLEIMREIMLA